MATNLGCGVDVDHVVGVVQVDTASDYIVVDDAAHTLRHYL